MKLLVFALLVSMKLVSAQYDYGRVLAESLLFYEAERSGYLPESNRISWRGDSATGDGSDLGMDLTGGWYDAGDHVKFGFPMAWSATTTAWGVWAFKQGFENIGELENALDSIKWPLDYFLKCIIYDDVDGAVSEFVGQVADGYDDHAYWGRPEQMTMARPAFKVDRNRPGTDLCGETAAALAAGSLAFNDTDPDYSATLLQAAKDLHEFAYQYRGKYSGTSDEGTDFPIPAWDFYGSSAYEDELTWSSIWLYIATGEAIYLERAEEFYVSEVAWAFSWDNKIAGYQVLMYQATGDATYATDVENFIRSWMPNGGITYTPGGLAWRDMWGALRYCGNTAAIAMLAAQQGIIASEAQSWAKGQIDYMLGSNPSGISYVISSHSGDYYPKKPHHRAASCNPDHNVQCNWDDYYTWEDNDSALLGALVGGPDQNDVYVDDRTNYQTNEVANDYNAGFQTALAGIVAQEEVCRMFVQPPKKREL